MSDTFEIGSNHKFGWLIWSLHHWLDIVIIKEDEGSGAVSCKEEKVGLGLGETIVCRPEVMKYHNENMRPGLGFDNVAQYYYWSQKPPYLPAKRNQEELIN